MKPRTKISLELCDIMQRMGYPKEFAEQITLNLNTDWTAQRMLGYLYQNREAGMEDVADEMLAILSDRNAIMQKHDLEDANVKWNRYLNEGFDTDE